MNQNKQMKQTKEQLLVELTRVRQSHEDWVTSDLSRRKEFARAFGWSKPKKQYDYTTEPYEPTWVEIFIEIGKLLSARNFMNFEGNLSELEVKLENLERNIRSEIHPNLP